MAARPVAPRPVSRRQALCLAVGLLVAVNLLNNRLAPGAYLATCAATAVLLLALARQAGCSWDELGLGRAQVGRGLRWALVAVVVVAAGYLAAALLPATRELLVDRRVGALPPGAVLFQAFVRVPFGTVLLEETAFRGVIYGLLLRDGRGWVRATAVSSVLFGLWHVLPALGLPTVNPILSGATAGDPFRGGLVVLGAVALTGLAGVLLCELRRRSGSLLAPAGLHVAANSLGYLASFAVLSSLSP